VTDPDEHPYPSDATVKELYACAFRCANPECTKPLYRQNNDTGDRILNSRVAHIHARRKGGPRWKRMTAAENRAAANLVLLCIEHSYEVDEFADNYPADLLRSWKAAQLAEYDEIQRAWPLADADVAEIVAASFDDRRVGMARAGATSVLALARSAGLLTAAARRGREAPYAEIAAWEATWQRTRNSMFAWNSETGERVYTQPSHSETSAHQHRVQTALAAAVNALAPLADALHGEARAVAAADPTLLPWCQWIDKGVAKVIRSAGRWPKPPPFEDDAKLEESLADLQRAIDALSATWRGETAEDPPEQEPEPAEPVETEGARVLREDRELLDEARPFSRVEHLPFDSALYERVRASLAVAAQIPPTMTFMSVELSATARLAAVIARNADDATFRELIANAVGQQPLSAAVALLGALANVAGKVERHDLEQEARGTAKAMIEDEAWRDRTVWVANETHGRMLLSIAAELSGSAELLAAKLESALIADPGLLDVLLASCAQWSEQLDRDTWDVTGIDRRYNELPPWFPTNAVVAEIHRQLPAITPAHAQYAERISNETERLAAYVLDLAATAAA
jgi:hypothetical protein